MYYHQDINEFHTHFNDTFKLVLNNSNNGFHISKIKK
jgi:hypothetical protein